MVTLWSKNYKELEAAGRTGMYLATIRPHAWPGYFMFQAAPNRGDWVTEYISTDLNEVITKAEQWLAGEMPDGFYSASD